MSQAKFSHTLWKQTCKCGYLSNSSAVEFKRPSPLFWINKGISLNEVYFNCLPYYYKDYWLHIIIILLYTHRCKTWKSAWTSRKVFFFYRFNCRHSATPPPTVKERIRAHETNSALLQGSYLYVASVMSRRSYVELLADVTSLKRAGREGATRLFSSTWRIQQLFTTISYLA